MVPETQPVAPLYPVPPHWSYLATPPAPEVAVDAGAELTVVVPGTLGAAPDPV